NPESSGGLWINIIVLLAAIGTDGYVLIKTMNQIAKESQSGDTGISIVSGSIKNVGFAAPPTRLVYYEDVVATFGSFVALVFVVLSHATGYYFLDGIGTLLIGLLLIGIAIKIGYDNTVGLIGVAAPKQVENRIAKLILSDEAVVDINKMRILKEGRQYHVEAYIELVKNLLLGDADDIKFRVRDAILADPDIDDVTLGIIETDDKTTWVMDDENEENDEGKH
ncbi:MAG TPA: cation transporter dimerization domain-containing protein, partial [Bacillota bacterium]|nr:cation transporter dimerization domain-containing protein [Bacillota bacterium]